MTGPKGAPNITKEDVERAQAVISSWLDKHSDVLTLPADFPTPGDVAHLRGLITQALADANARGYDHGIARGRRLVANAVRDALDGEGLL